MSGCLHYLSSAFKTLEQGQIYLTSQSAANTFISFVLEPTVALAFAEKLSKFVVEHGEIDKKVYGVSWNDLYGNSSASKKTGARRNAWWREKRTQLLDIADKQVSRQLQIYLIIKTGTCLCL